MIGIDRTLRTPRSKAPALRLGNAFATRLLGRRAVCIGGPDAARLIYDESRFVRRNAIPTSVIDTRFGSPVTGSSGRRGDGTSATRRERRLAEGAERAGDIA